MQQVLPCEQTSPCSRALQKKHESMEYTVKVGYDIIPISEREAPTDTEVEMENVMMGEETDVKIIESEEQRAELMAMKQELDRREKEIIKKAEQLEKKMEEENKDEKTFEERVQEEVKRRLGKQEIVETAVKAVGDCILVHTEANHTREALAAIKNQAVTTNLNIGKMKARTSQIGEALERLEKTTEGIECRLSGPAEIKELSV